MRISTRTLAIAAIALTTGYATQAVALPIFSFTEYGGFTNDVGMATYSDLITGDASLIPAATPLYSTMSWVGGRALKSSLKLGTVTDPTALLTDTWTTISTLIHDNKVTPGSSPLV